MDISSFIKAIVSPEMRKFFSNQDIIKVGDELTGKILDFKADGRTLVDFGKFRALAEVSFPVAKSQVIQVKVAEIGEQIKLSLIDHETKKSDLTKNLISKLEIVSDDEFKKLQSDIKQVLNRDASLSAGEKLPRNIKNALLNIHSHFEPLNVSSSMEKLIPQLKAYIENGGILFESKMENAIQNILNSHEKISAKQLSQFPQIREIIAKDLKPNLIILKEFFTNREMIDKSADRKELESIRVSIDRMINDIESQQNLAVNRKESTDQTQVFTHTLHLNKDNQKAKLKIYYRNKKGDVNKGIRLSLLLSMDQMGEIRTDFFNIKSDLNITFFVTNEKIKKMIEDHMDQIKEELSRIFGNLVINVIVSPTEIAQFDSEDLTGSNSKMVDLMV
ncbi:MAG: hypothetical protein SWH54_17650 [Thermodesulfobacteriota bacterium]|nr:hypothetical protein [Thermodesulfobacteriota bacterium]